MNKTLTINLGGIVFHIEEDAYEKLHQYLSSIKGYFTDSDGRDEIIADIELRIAELFQELLKGGRQVVVMADVERMMNQMGRPEEFAGEEPAAKEPSQEKSAPSASGSSGARRRRFFRNPDDKVLGGVCGGIAAHFDTDPLYIRLGFVLAFILGLGSSLIIYIILWMLIPEANSTAEKLEMRGEPVNISNIEKTIRDEAGHFKKKVNDLKEEVTGSKTRNFIERVFSGMGTVFSQLLKALVKVLAIFIVLMALLILISIILGVLGVVGGLSMHLPFTVSSFFDFAAPSNHALAVVSLLLVTTIPFLMLLYGGIKLLFNIRTRRHYIGLTALTLWLIGLGGAAYSFAHVFRQFSDRGSVRESIPVSSSSTGILYLEASRGWMDESHEEDEEHFCIDNELCFIDDSMAFRRVRLNIIKADSTEFELVKIASARGPNRKEAVSVAERINYNMKVQDSMVVFNPCLVLGKGEKFRNQKLRFVLKVPVGKTVFIGSSMEDIIYDIDNVTNTHDRKMVGRRWIMSPEGLACVDCDGIHFRETDSHRRRKITVEIPEEEWQ